MAKNIIKKPLNERIARYREFAGYSQATAAKELGMKVGTYGRLEREGNPSPELLMRMSVLFNVNVNVLLFGEEYDAGKEEKKFEEQQKVFTRLNDDNKFKGFEIPPPMVLTATERNLVGGFRELTKEQKSIILNQINEMREANKKK